MARWKELEKNIPLIFIPCNPIHLMFFIIDNLWRPFFYNSSNLVVRKRAAVQSTVALISSARVFFSGSLKCATRGCAAGISQCKRPSVKAKPKKDLFRGYRVAPQQI